MSAPPPVGPAGAGPMAVCGRAKSTRARRVAPSSVRRAGAAPKSPAVPRSGRARRLSTSCPTEGRRPLRIGQARGMDSDHPSRPQPGRRAARAADGRPAGGCGAGPCRLRCWRPGCWWPGCWRPARRWRTSGRPAPVGLAARPTAPGAGSVRGAGRAVRCPGTVASTWPPHPAPLCGRQATGWSPSPGGSPGVRSCRSTTRAACARPTNRWWPSCRSGDPVLAGQVIGRTRRSRAATACRRAACTGGPAGARPPISTRSRCWRPCGSGCCRCGARRRGHRSGRRRPGRRPAPTPRPVHRSPPSPERPSLPAAAPRGRSRPAGGVTGRQRTSAAALVAGSTLVGGSVLAAAAVRRRRPRSPPGRRQAGQSSAGSSAARRA